MLLEFLQGDARNVLKCFNENHFDCVVTSPPYYGLRNYGVDGQIGLEDSLDEYLDVLTGVGLEILRVLKPEGTFWFNIGDSYANDGKWGGATSGKHSKGLHGTDISRKKKRSTNLKSKDLMLVPARVALRFQELGWYIRSEIIWHKPNPMPESVLDRPTCAHEKIWLFTKSDKYFYNADLIREDFSDSRMGNPGAYKRRSSKDKGEIKSRQDLGFVNSGGMVGGGNGWERGKELKGKNARNVWTIPPSPFKGSHFATFPVKLVETCLKAGCPPCGKILDPFGGAGTTALVARELGMNCTSIELNQEYIYIAKHRLRIATFEDYCNWIL